MTGPDPEIAPTPSGPSQGESEACGTVFIAEVIWFGDNPVDGRKRLTVAVSLDAALQAIRGHDIYGGDLVATEVSPSALGSETATTWAVHERGTAPDDEGLLWITREEVTRG